VPERKAVNIRLFAQDLARSLKQIFSMRLQFCDTDSLFCLMDTAAAAYSALIMRHLANLGMVAISNLFLFTWLMPADFLYSVK
jgi:hypothetical protein